YAATTGYVALMETAHNPVTAIEGLYEALDMYRGLGTSFGRNIIRDWLPALAQLGRFETVAIVDGAASGLSIWPARVAAGIEAARTALGADAYERAKARGGTLTNEELNDELRFARSPDPWVRE